MNWDLLLLAASVFFGLLNTCNLIVSLRQLRRVRRAAKDVPSTDWEAIIGAEFSDAAIDPSSLTHRQSIDRAERC